MSDGEFQVPEDYLMWPNLSMKEQEVLSRLNWEQLKRKPMTGIEKIAQERLEQKIKHGRTVKSDYELNADYQLVDAAIKLMQGGMHPEPDNWNVDIWNKMLSKGDEERLVIAGALIAAELDRLNFKE